MRLKLFAVHHAGGGPAAFREWGQHLPAEVELVPLCLPGRGPRSTLASLREWPALVDFLFADVTRYLPAPCAFFGHSMGGLVAFELAHALRERSGREALWLGISACAAPRCRARPSRWLECGDDVVIEYLRSLGGTPRGVLEAPELLAHLLPMIRADLHLSDTYTCVERAPLRARLLVLGGTEDTSIARAESLQAWSLETSGPFRQETLTGGHFFIDTERRRVLELVSEDLRPAYDQRITSSDRAGASQTCSSHDACSSSSATALPRSQ